MMKTRLLPRSQRLLWLSVLGSITFQGYAAELTELRLAHKSNITINLNGTLPVSGVITSAKDGSPIIGASVFVKNSPKVGTSTDATGKFRLSIPDNITSITLVVSMVGYESQTVELSANQTSVSISLKENVQNIQEVVEIGRAHV